MSTRKLHPRDVILLRRLWFEGWTDYKIWKEYQIPFPVIKKAKKIIERQAAEEFENNEAHAVELAKFKDRLKFVIDNIDTITNDKNMSHKDRINFDSIKLEYLAMLRDATEASMYSSDPRSALKKIVEKRGRPRQHC